MVDAAAGVIGGMLVAAVAEASGMMCRKLVDGNEVENFAE